jgi:hypothetical protein
MYSPQNVATYLDYSADPSSGAKTIVGRPFDPNQEAQSILDTLVDPSGPRGIEEWVVYDGGFRVGSGTPSQLKSDVGSEEAVRVEKVLSSTEAYYRNLAESAGPDERAENLEIADQIKAAKGTYEDTVLNYWRGKSTTPPDVVQDEGAGKQLLGTDGKPIAPAISPPQDVTASASSTVSAEARPPTEPELLPPRRPPAPRRFPKPPPPPDSNDPSPPKNRDNGPKVTR